jgi:hypothetical protein
MIAPVVVIPRMMTTVVRVSVMMPFVSVSIVVIAAETMGRPNEEAQNKKIAGREHAGIICL